ncbi:MAG: hypothetical protein SFY32_00505 [Bacteroidota bacterium]|nr:hypothetical protein [Bacteroidota bacterium]
MQKINLVQQYIQAAYEGNVEKAASFLSEDISLVMGGKNQLTGKHKGIPAFFAAFKAMLELTGFSYKLEKKQDWLESDTRVILIAQESAEKQGQRHYFDRVIEYYFEHNVIQRITIYEASPEITDWVFA